jgi:hypothetical protein
MNEPKQFVPDKRPWTIAQVVRQLVQADDVIYQQLLQNDGQWGVTSLGPFVLASCGAFCRSPRRSVIGAVTDITSISVVLIRH